MENQPAKFFSFRAFHSLFITSKCYLILKIHMSYKNCFSSKWCSIVFIDSSKHAMFLELNWNCFHIKSVTHQKLTSRAIHFKLKNNCFNQFWGIRQKVLKKRLAFLWFAACFMISILNSFSLTYNSYLWQ